MGVPLPLLNSLCGNLIQNVHVQPRFRQVLWHATERDLLLQQSQ